MTKIHVLDSETIDKIAAGEVVERPSSVVKELVENAVDAGASAVTVEIRDGGIEFIRVTDNGTGMECSQLRTAFLRHATSKIESASDLERISSLGFRGEALSSIAAVAKVEVITKTKDSVTGSRILLEGSREIEFEEVGAPEGTTFLMRNLFFNTPVRRKFLKQPATEGGYIVDLMEHLALSRPDISFKLAVGSQMKFHTSGNGDLKEVIYRIYGRDVAASLVPIQAEKDGIRVEGYLGKPVMVRSNRNFEICFVNGRFIRSSVVSRSVEEGYKEYLMQHKFPFCVLHITMAADKVDVNVHPTKMDVRFRNTIEFSNFLTDSVRDALRKKEMIPEASFVDERERRAAISAEKKEWERNKTPEPFERQRAENYRVKEETRYRTEAAGNEIQKPETQDFMQKPVWNRVKMQENDEKSWKMTENLSNLPVSANSKSDNFFEETAEDIEKQDFMQKSASNRIKMQEKEENSTKMTDSPAKFAIFSNLESENADAQSALEAQMNFFDEKILTADNRARFRIIGQVFETYWLVQFEDKMLMIDQHAAHEKVNYERLMKQYHAKSVASQTLMPPVIVSLSGQEETVLKDNKDVFASLGFEVEAFGGSEYALRSVPTDLYGCNEREMFLEVLDQLAEGTGFGSIRVIEEKIASMSCKAAVKGNNILSVVEAEALIDELLTLENPYNCPHGRPTIVAMTKQEMDRKFKRIVN